jgi:phospholipase C
LSVKIKKRINAMINGNPVKHVIVLVLENRSFDHMLGFLPGGGDLNGEEFNWVDPADQASEKVFVSKTVGYLTDTADPSHEFESVQAQQIGRAHV